MNYHGFHNLKNAAPIKDLAGDTVFLKVTFKEFYRGRAAGGAIFEDSEGFAYKMMFRDFEKVLNSGKVFQDMNNGQLKTGLSGEFKVKNRSGHLFIEMVLDNE